MEHGDVPPSLAREQDEREPKVAVQRRRRRPGLAEIDEVDQIVQRPPCESDIQAHGWFQQSTQQRCPPLD
jgi:hypothetical protein